MFTWGATEGLGSKGDGLCSRKKHITRYQASHPWLSVTVTLCLVRRKSTDPPSTAPSPGQGMAHRNDRALTCQPSREVTARPQRHIYRKSIVLTLKGKNQKVKLQNHQQNYFLKQNPK